MLDCKFALLPGEALPAEFHHRARERLLPLFFRFMVSTEMTMRMMRTMNGWVQRGFHVTSGAFRMAWTLDMDHASTIYQLCLDLKEYMYFFESSIFLNFPETDVHLRELHFEFKTTGRYWDIKD
ncbi:hypothetical protein Rs2_44432 [Raphanus sativus]|nr:hypothetical protein Rs2_44432 [Raphanus sativus]